MYARTIDINKGVGAKSVGACLQMESDMIRLGRMISINTQSLVASMG